MSKMREAFDREFPDAKDPQKIIMLAYFEAGYQAAIAAVKESGPDCYRGQEGVTDLAYDTVDPYYPLYKLPED